MSLWTNSIALSQSLLLKILAAGIFNYSYMYYLEKNNNINSKRFSSLMKTHSLGGRRFINIKMAWLLCIVVAWCTATPSVAQDTAGGDASSLNLRWGVRAGMTSSGFYHYDMKQQKHTGSLAGVAAGGFISIRPMDFLNVSLEILYMQQGGTRTELSSSSIDGSPIATTAHTRLHNLEVPLLLKINIPGISSAFKPQFIAGPALGYNIKAIEDKDISYQFGDYYVTANDTEDVRSDYRSLQYGVYAGAGIEVPMNTQMLSVDFRYRYGINPINNGMSITNMLSNANDIRTNSYMLTLGLSF